MSGKTKEYLFSPSESAGDIAQFVFDNWPPEWEEESVSEDMSYNEYNPNSFHSSLLSQSLSDGLAIKWNDHDLSKK